MKDIDWGGLERLRAAFLQGDAGKRDYWQSEEELASYDATFAQRIGWKWDYALAELRRRGWSPPGGDLLDWGCGSGIAGRAFLDFFGRDSARGLYLWDRSGLAMRFAADRARAKYSGLSALKGIPENPQVILLSHVLTELSPQQIATLAELLARATAVLWVEPGTRSASAALIAMRERLRGRFHVIAPCTHENSCGMLNPENARHWCHHFATPPPEAFTHSHWGRFAKMLEIDMRDLPLSFLVLDKRPPPVLPVGATRRIGRPRLYKPHALLLGCDISGVRERRLPRRSLPEQYRQLKKDLADPLQIWRCGDDEILETNPLFPL